MQAQAQLQQAQANLALHEGQPQSFSQKNMFYTCFVIIFRFPS